MTGLLPADNQEAEDAFIGIQGSLSSFISTGRTLCANGSVAIASNPITGDLGVCTSR